MKKPTQILVVITIVFVLLILGFFIGRITNDGTISVYTERSHRSEHIGADETQPDGLININTASLTELQDLPGIGPKTAEEIIKYRELNGPFKRKKDIMNVTGIAEKTYEELEDMIIIEDD